MKIGIRADGGSDIGMGHVMRCLSLAQEFRAANHKVIFISNDPVGQAKIRENGFPALAVAVDAEVEALTGIIREQSLDCLIIDSYHVDENCFRQLKKVCSLLCYIDDLNYFTYPVDILINGNFAAETIKYRKFAPAELLLLGIEYNLIRQEFRSLPPAVVKPQLKRILITMGAADPVNFSSSLIRAIRLDKALDLIQLDIIVGGSNPFQDELIRLSRMYPQIILHHNVQQMVPLMQQADIAFSAGGSTLYELCACGVPTLAVIIADNQEFIVHQLSASGYVKDLGWFNRITGSEVGEAIRNFNLEERKIMSAKGQKLVDGQGTMRVRNAITEYYRSRHAGVG